MSKRHRLVYKIMRDWWKPVARLESNRNAKVFMVLIGLALEHKKIYANNKWIGAACRMSPRPVTDALRELKARGWIRWRRKFVKEGKAVLSSYRILTINWKGLRASVLQERVRAKAEREAKREKRIRPVLPPQPPSACKLCGEGMVPEGLDAVEYYACSDCGWTWPEEKDSDNPLAPTPHVL